MFERLTECGSPILGALMLGEGLGTLWYYFLIILGFSFLIFVHELGHFLAAKWCGVRVSRFAVGFGRALVSYRSGIGWRLGSTYGEYVRRIEDYLAKRGKSLPVSEPEGEIAEAELAEIGSSLDLGETEYRFNWMPLGGYVKMQGQEDFEIDKSGEIAVKDDPRSFLNKPVWQRMVIVSSGVVMNVVFAAIAFMVVHMVGTEVEPVIVDMVEGGSPAERAGLQVGDRITEIDGEMLTSFRDLKMAVMLAKPDRPLSVKFERPGAPGSGPTTHMAEILPVMDEAEGSLRLGVGVAGNNNNVVADVLRDPALPAHQQLYPGDEIVAIAGEKTSNFRDIVHCLAVPKGRYATLEVRRKLGDGTVRTLHLPRRLRPRFLPTGTTDRDSGHLLGFVPRLRITDVIPNGRADLGGLRRDDVIVQWGDRQAPTITEVLESIAANRERDIRVVVLRPIWDQPGTLIEVVVRPEGKGVFGQGKPTLGMEVGGEETDRAVVADIVTEVRKDLQTPAARLSGLLPRGSLLLKLNDEAVAGWLDAVDKFVKLAGTDVRVTWRTPDGAEQSGVIHVPKTLGTVFELPPDHQITRIDGKQSALVEVNGQKRPGSVGHWLGASFALEKCVGRTVEVEHQGIQDRVPQTVKVEVTAEMLDTWPMRISYASKGELDLVTERMTEIVRVGNPLKAMMMGIDRTIFFVKQVYVVIQRMVIDQSVGFDTVAGPVGIVQAGSEIARKSTVDLIFFLGLISANLAVINFLPLPIFDGGVMVFLLIEKIKGGPVPIKIQVVTQMVGLALIITIFVYVLFNDLQRVFG